jgi:Domain of unknown function (DUF202)
VTGDGAARGLPLERTSLAWWRTAQTALGCAALFTKAAIGRPPIGWIAVGLALLIAVLIWARAHRGPAATPRGMFAAIGSACVVLAVVVFASVLVDRL